MRKSTGDTTAAGPETLIVETRKGSRTTHINLGRHGVIDIDKDDTDGDRVIMGDDLTVERGEVVLGDAVSLGGDVHVDGKVTGSVVSVGGTVTLGDSAYVGEDAVSIGGDVDRAEGSTVVGKVVTVAGPGGLMFPGLRKHKYPMGEHGSTGSRIFHLVRTLVFFLVLFAFAALALAVARRRIEYASDYLSREPIPALLYGLVSPILLLIGFVLLCITLIGIPVALALLVLYPAFIFLGWVVTGLRIGRTMRPDEPTPLRTMFTGLAVLSGFPILVAFLRLLGMSGFMTFAILFAGVAISGLAAFAGLGAIIGTKFRRPPEAAVPPAGWQAPPAAMAGNAPPPIPTVQPEPPAPIG